MLWLLPAAVSTVACFALQHGSASAFPALVPGYAKLEERKRLDWDTRIVGLAHGARPRPASPLAPLAAPLTPRAAAAALVVGLGSLWVVLDPPAPIVDDRFFGYSDESQLFISIAFGYFICGPPARPRPPRSARGRRNGADGGWDSRRGPVRLHLGRVGRRVHGARGGVPDHLRGLQLPAPLRPLLRLLLPALRALHPLHAPAYAAPNPPRPLKPAKVRGHLRVS